MSAVRLTLAVVLFALLAVPTASAAPAARTAGQHVMIQNYAYSPAALSVRAGETVTWTNHDEAKHDVVGSGFRSPLLAKGESWSYTFPTAGSYSYYCSLHPDMRAKVTVTPAPQPSTPAAQPQDPPAARQAPGQAAPSASTPAVDSHDASGGLARPRKSAASSTPPSVAAQPVQAAPQVAPAATQSIDPMLLVAGVVTGVAVLCLLLLGGTRRD